MERGFAELNASEFNVLGVSIRLIYVKWILCIKPCTHNVRLSRPCVSLSREQSPFSNFSMKSSQLKPTGQKQTTIILFVCLYVPPPLSSARTNTKERNTRTNRQINKITFLADFAADRPFKSTSSTASPTHHFSFASTRFARAAEVRNCSEGWWETGHVPMLGSSCADPEAVKVSGGLDMDRYWLIRHGRKSTGKGLEG